MGRHRLYSISPKEAIQKAIKKKKSSLSRHILLRSHIFGIFQYNKSGGFPGLVFLGAMDRKETYAWTETTMHKLSFWRVWKFSISFLWMRSWPCVSYKCFQLVETEMEISSAHSNRKQASCWQAWWPPYLIPKVSPISQENSFSGDGHIVTACQKNLAINKYLSLSVSFDGYLKQIELLNPRRCAPLKYWHQSGA